MNDLFQAALEVQGFLHEHGWRFCIIGGLAVLRWGEPRTTQDVDVSLLTGFTNEEAYIQQIARRFSLRLPDGISFALEKRVLLVRASNGRPIDIALAGIPFEERMIERASAFEFAPDVALVTCSAEDLVVLKAFAGREQDWLDLRGILAAQQSRLDWDYIDRHLLPLCELKDDLQAPRRLAELRQTLQGP